METEVVSVQTAPTTAPVVYPTPDIAGNSLSGPVPSIITSESHHVVTGTSRNTHTSTILTVQTFISTSTIRDELTTVGMVPPPVLAASENKNPSNVPSQPAVRTGKTEQKSHATPTRPNAQEVAPLTTSRSGGFAMTSPPMLPTNSVVGQPLPTKRASNHVGTVAGVTSGIAILCLIFVLLAICIMRRRWGRRLHRNHDIGDGGSPGAYHVGGDGSSSNILNIDAEWMYQEGATSVTDNRDFDAWSRYSDVFSHGTLGQRAMSVRGMENYSPSLDAVSTLPEYVETQQSVSPPAYSNLSACQTSEMSDGLEDNLEDRETCQETVTRNGYARMEDNGQH